MDDPVLASDAPLAPDMLALDEAANAAGGYSALAGKIDVPASLPFMWRKRGSVPAAYCPAIERETGVKCERLNSKADWAVLRATDKEGA